MKVRIGFVSNSSSSSFTCNITGNTESGYDYGLEECGMCGCENNHVFMQKFLLIPIEQWKEEVIEQWKEENRKEGLSEEKIEEIDEYFYDDDLYDDINSKYCPICTLKHITDHTRISYLKYKFSVVEKELDKEIKEKFNNLDEFKKEMKNAGIW